MSEALPCNRLENVRRRAECAMGGNTMDSIVTCPASRHLLHMADALASGKPILDEYPMFTEDPKHCAASIYSVLESLWKDRTRIKRLTT